MALEVRPFASAMQLTYDMGTDLEGKQKKTTRTIAGLKIDAIDEDLYAVASSLFSLQEPYVEKVVRINRSMYAEV